MTDEAVVLEEQRYEYQPTDDNGLPMGGPQVIKWTPKFVGDTKELIEKLQENNVRLQRKLREANRKVKTGKLDPEEIPDDAPRYQDPLELNPTDLSADDLIEITKQMGDPTKVKSAFERMAQATFGATPAQIRNAISESQKAAQDQKIAREVDKFLIDTPEYYICTENWNTIVNWMERFNLAPIEANFKLAYRRLTDADILLRAGGTVPNRPVEPQVVPAAPVQVFSEVDPSVSTPPSGTFDNTSEFGGQIRTEPVEIINYDPSVSTPPPAPVQRVSTSLTNNNTTSGQMPQPVPGADIVWVSPAVYDSKGRLTNPSRTFVGLKALDAMPPEEYERRFRGEAGFKEKVDKLLSTRKINPNQR